MRLAIISDIHGNHVALQAVLEDIKQQRIDSIIFLGDAASLGPQPREVLDTLKSLNCPCVQGNHDAALLNLNFAIHYKIAEPLLPTMQWCATFLNQSDIEFLRSFKQTHTVALGESLRLLCFHGSPYSNTDLILSVTPSDELEGYLRGQSADVMAGGHTHIQMLRQHNSILLINPGSVGNAFRKPLSPDAEPSLLPWSEYAIVESKRGTLSADMRRVSFDIAQFKRVLKQSALPIKDWWLQQY